MELKQKTVIMFCIAVVDQTELKTIKVLTNLLGIKIMNTENKGIDYGMGNTNIDKIHNIRYGVIHQNEVLQAWADDSEPYYGEPGEETQETEDMYNDMVEPINWFIDDGEYIAECDDSGDIFITKSPYYTRAQFCSPCAPGACYLMNPCNNGEKTYCFGSDWFEDNKAPYPVYRVSDNTLIE